MAVATRTDLKEVVRLVNLARKAVERTRISSLRKGDPHQADQCPLANSLDGGGVWVDGTVAAYEAITHEQADAIAEAWDTTFTDVGGGEYEIALPEPLQEFVTEFDDGVFPELQK